MFGPKVSDPTAVSLRLYFRRPNAKVWDLLATFGNEKELNKFLKSTRLQGNYRVVDRRGYQKIVASVPNLQELYQ